MTKTNQPQTPLLDAVYHSINNAPKALSRIALYIAQDPPRVPALTVATIARRCDSGEASVIRFCKSLGFSGFQDFKMAFAAEVERKKMQYIALGSIVDEANIPPEVLGISTPLQHALSDTARLIDTAQIDRIVEKIQKAKRIEIFGMGASSAGAYMLMVRLVWLGFPAHSLSSANISHGLARTLGPTDIAIGISNSGLSTATINFLETADEVGAYTVAMTSHSDCPMARIVDETLLFSSSGFSPEAGTSLHIPSIIVISEYIGRCLQNRRRQTN